MIEVSHIDHMGTDLAVVNAARVSFAKVSSAFREQDARLLSYLARNSHWSPFAHPQISLHIKAPIFVARQLQKHQIGFVWNEVSRRYVDAKPEFYTPDRWRGRAADKKQGSSSVEVLSVATGQGEIASPGLLLEDLHRTALETYDALIAGGVAPEMARMALPLTTMTEWHWTGSLAAWARMCALRQAPDAQAETGEVAWLVAEIIGRLFPVSWAALCGCEFQSSTTGDAA